MTEKTMLFTPPMATRSAGGVTFWWQPEEDDDPRLDILDNDGNVLRTFLPDGQDAEEVGPEGRYECFTSKQSWLELRALGS